MKEQKLRKYIKESIKKMVEGSRSTVKKGSEEKYKDKFGRKVTKMTMVSKKGRETPMLQYDGENEDNVISDFDCKSLKGIQDYHYDDKVTDVYIYETSIAITYKKENKTYFFPAVLFTRPKKGEDGMVTVESTHNKDGVEDPEKGTPSEETTIIEIPINCQRLIRAKYENRDTSKTKDLENVRFRQRSRGSGILKNKDKALFKGGSDKEGHIDLGGILKKARYAKKGSQFSG